MTLPQGCPIPHASGDVGPVGPVDAPILIVGEAAGDTEAIRGLPFCGTAGDQLDKLLRMVDIKREEVRIANALRCHPPDNWLVNAPWEMAALAHCRPQLDAVLSEPHKVIVPLGGTALRQVLNLPRTRSKDGVKVADFHGAPVRLGDKWVVPTFHPAYLSRGAQKLTKVVCYDLQVAKDIAEAKLFPDASKPELVIDPPIDWFSAWASYLSPDDWLSCDIETPEKEDDEAESVLGDAPILRINFAYSVDQGVTVPWSPEYMPTILALLSHPCRKIWWNGWSFDLKKLKAQGIIPAGRQDDGMEMWHVLQSSLPRGLGFVSPLYSHHGPWKHLGSKNLSYCAIDPVAALRNAFGIYRDLQSANLWEVYERRMYQLDTICFRPAEEIGLPFDKDALAQYNTELEAIISKVDSQIQALVPESICPVSTPLKRRPDSMEGVYESVEEDLVKFCESCGAEQISSKHRCKDRSLVPSVVLQSRQVSRYYRRLPFNPASWQQVLAYIKFKKHKPGKAKKTKKDTTDKKTLKRLVKTGDPFYSLCLTRRAAGKMSGTYGAGILKKLDSNSRVHSTFTNTPSTLRKASTGPNLQNLASHVEFADGFRRCVVAAPGCKLLSADFSGIEAVLTGYFSGDPQYLRLAKLSIHSFVLSHLVNQPADLKWSDDDLRSHFKSLKKSFPDQYDKAKRCVHGRNYGLTEYGMSDYYPEVFPKRSDAARVISIYEEVCPKLKPWWGRLRKAAHERKFLGGFASGRAQTHDAKYAELMTEFAHPFGYRHWFWDVIQYTRRGGKWQESVGEDGKRCLAFFPQSTAMGVVQEAMLRLFDATAPHFIGDAYFGQTPLRAQIHDDLTLEVPEPKIDTVLPALVAEMTRPVLQLPMPASWGLGDFLSIGVEVKIGKNWAPKSESNPDGMAVLSGAESLAADVFREEEDDEAPDDTALPGVA